MLCVVLGLVYDAEYLFAPSQSRFPFPVSTRPNSAPHPPTHPHPYPFLTVWMLWQVRQVLSLALRRWGFQVCAVKNEADAITKLNLQGTFCVLS